MFIITNRNIDETKDGLNMIGHKINENGPNELRVVEVEKKNKEWLIKILPDLIDEEMKKEVDIDTENDVYASAYAARKTVNKIRYEKNNLLLFVHGFNNDIEAIVNRAQELSENYNLEVIAFSWPANGGGVKGVASYKSDKRDAKASVGALDRVLEKIGSYLDEFNSKLRLEVYEKAETKYPENLEKRDEYITEMMDEGCKFTVNMMLHSMGNYLYKHLLLSSVYGGNQLTFDNIILAAADANNKEHELWVDNIQARKRIYITINENDFALRTSRMKSGENQLARLGHYTYNLTSKHSVYVDFTNADKVGNSHAYFEGDSLNNKEISSFFRAALNGNIVEDTIDFDNAKFIYTV